MKLFDLLQFRPGVAGALEAVFAVTVTTLVTVLFVAMVAYPVALAA